ncbi:hypothetical protein [Microtetraspora sp. NBRC 16547]|uniref:hypothetical protein n=1 Tax=Microtetraspora sp. NBRC 16547 TaxID=3030993 RepID=UPI002555AEFE|nr:hypothetical protein [Microtetraspora sp. NBRC 16547]
MCWATFAWNAWPDVVSQPEHDDRAVRVEYATAYLQIWIVVITNGAICGNRHIEYNSWVVTVGRWYS